MTVAVKQTIHIKLGGGMQHRLGIVIAAEVATRKGYKVEDMTTWRGQDMEPDLVIVRRDRVPTGTGDGRGTVGGSWRTFRYRVEVIDTHDPVPDWDPKGGFDEVIKINVGDKDLNGILVECELRIP